MDGYGGRLLARIQFYKNVHGFKLLLRKFLTLTKKGPLEFCVIKILTRDSISNFDLFGPNPPKYPVIKPF